MFVSVTGATVQSKVERVREKMKEKGVSVLLITALDEIACKSKYQNSLYATKTEILCIMFQPQFLILQFFNNRK